MGVNIQTIREIRLFLVTELAEIYDEQETGAIANLVIKTELGVSRLHGLYLPEHPVNKKEAERIVTICNELKTGKPIQYILGESVFYDCVIKVNNYTLIPRPETEELVDLIIKENKGFRGPIIDFGTGTGCIAIALAVNLQEASVTGIDISPEAITLAVENARLNNVGIDFIERDILNFENMAIRKAGIVVSNPPYVRNSEKKLMNRNVVEFEPHSALFVPDNDPLLFYRSILNISKEILIKGGKIYFEINESMGDSMLQLLETFGYSDIKIISDINGKDRIIKAIKNG